MRRDEILMIYGEDYQTMTKRLLCEAGLDTMIADKDASIGIKPNILGPYPAEDGGTTHPQIVVGIIEYLKEHGFHNLTIAEGSWVGDYTREAFCVCGYEDLAKQYEVNLLDTQQDTFYEQDCGGLPLHICDCVRQFDFLINVPGYGKIFIQYRHTDIFQRAGVTAFAPFYFWRITLLKIFMHFLKTGTDLFS